MKPSLQPLLNLLWLIVLLLLLLLQAADATTMPDSSDDDSAIPSKSWANDTSGVSLLDDLEDAIISDKVIGAKLWIVARRKIVRKLQVTHNFCDFLVNISPTGLAKALFPSLQMLRRYTSFHFWICRSQSLREVSTWTKENVWS